MSEVKAQLLHAMLDWHAAVIRFGMESRTAAEHFERCSSLVEPQAQAAPATAQDEARYQVLRHSAHPLNGPVEVLETFSNGQPPSHLYGEGLDQWCDQALAARQQGGQGHPHHPRNEAMSEVAKLQSEVDRLNAIINTPHTDDFLQAVSIEAEHQRQRWGARGDAGKEASDWFWLLGYLSGKALAAFVKGDRDKGLHHIISSAAALKNWHMNATGARTAMRPGTDQGTKP